MRQSWRLLMTILLCAAVAPGLSSCSRGGSPAKRVFILGIDGMDPKLLQRFADEGRLPNFKKLMEEGDFRPLQTVMPPLSPAAWSTFITGMDPGGHGIFDFIHRDPKTMLPEFAMSQTVDSDWNIPVGDWIVPLSGGSVIQMRQGTPFWHLLENAGIPTTIFRMPVNFPPEPPGHSFSGMGTPDVKGTSGTFSFYTDSPHFRAGEVSGGRIIRVPVVNHRVSAKLEGPENSFHKDRPTLTVDLEVAIDPENPVAMIQIGESRVVLKEGEWSPWVPVEFEALPYLASVSAVGRLYLQEVRPEFRLYVSPLQISPAAPAMPISSPEGWAQELHRELGYFYTQELPEETKAYSAGVLDGAEFWTQAQSVFQERRKALDYFLDNYDEGLLFFYFSSVDQTSHMLWRYLDPEHPFHDSDQTLETAIRTVYEEMDESLGAIRARLNPEDTLIVMSDHGFSSFSREVNLNTWLLEKGYVTLKNPADQGKHPFFLNVDWSRTKIYAMGLNGIYLNQRGRESNGIVSQGEESQRLLDELESELLKWVDPETGSQVVTLLTQTARDFKGHAASNGPDAIIGYNRGYRTSWKSPLGEFPLPVLTPNSDAWSGDHSIDYRLVSGVLLTNRKITLDQPALFDLTVAVLDEYGVSKLPEMIGQDCLSPE